MRNGRSHAVTPAAALNSQGGAWGPNCARIPSRHLRPMATPQDQPAAGPGSDWDERSRRFTLERVALAAARSAAREGWDVHADPEDPDEGDIGRRYYLDVDELTHTDDGWVTGTRRVRFELHLTRVGELDGGPVPAAPTS